MKKVMKIMKYILTFSIILFWFFTAHSQTYIAPIIGYDFSRIKPTSNYWKAAGYLNIRDEGFSIKSIFYGIKIDQIITRKLDISYEINYNQKSAKVNVGESDVSLTDNMKFNYFRNNLSLYFKVNKYLKTGIGYDFNLIKNLKFYPDDFFRSDRSRYEHGISTRISTEIKNFQVMAYYHKSLHFNKNDYSDVFNINSFGIYTGYRFRIFHNKTKRIDCPKF
jgi:hypothetical protein